MRILIALFVLVFVAAPYAQAQDDVIKIIQPDGSVVIFNPFPDAPQKPLPPVKENSAPKKAPPQQQARARSPEPPPPAIEPTAGLKTKPLHESVVPKQEEVRNISISRTPSYPSAPDMAKPRHKPLPGAVPRSREITGEMAKYIALEEAPPASGIEVVRATYQDKPAFVVMFQTEDALHEVLVDGISGEILETNKRAAPTKKTYVPMPVSRKP